MTKRVLFASFLFFVLFIPVRAGVVLQAMVVEVQNGNTLIAINQGRKVTVILEAVDAPQKGHAFDGIATQHLSRFVLGKLVAVEYSAIGAKSTLIGKVFVDKLDVGQQMIRDGAARFDRSRERNLSSDDRVAYSQSEAAARSEKRGVWQDGVVWPERAASQQAVMGARATADSKPAGDDPFRSVTFDELARKAAAKPPAPPVELRWPMFSPPGADFSLRIPPGGQDIQLDFVLPSGEPVRASMYAVQHLNIEYLTLWAVGPDMKQDMNANADRSLESLMEIFRSRGYPCEFTKSKEMPREGYKGYQIGFKDCMFEGAVRLFHKVEGNDLRYYAIAVFATNENQRLVDQFLDSFSVSR